VRRFPDFQHDEFKIFKKLNSPHKIQDFLDGIPINFELHGETYRSPLFTLRHNEAHCMEGALLAGAILWYHRQKPLIVDLNTVRGDENHIITLFRHNGRWGAFSKTNHAVLRYRDPVYRNIRELAMSYFHEYFKDNGKKTLTSYSVPYNLLQHGTDWLTTKKNLWNIVSALDYIPHAKILEHDTRRRLRRAHPIELKAGDIVEWEKPK